jgi:hypothetical protein
MQDVEQRLERIQRLIKAAEDWAGIYDKSPETKAKLIKNEVKLERLMRGYFRDLANRTNLFINWYAYNYHLNKLQAAKDDFTVDVVVSEQLDDEDGLILKIIYEPIASAIALGALASEETYKIPQGLSSTDELIQKAAKELIADLVGKRITPDGLIVDNPKAKYRISDKTRKDIRESINTSLNLGETQDEAVKRLQKTIKNPVRAKMIAQTESVNAYQHGVYTYGEQSGAIGKEWQTVGATDACQTFADYGAVPFDYAYSDPRTGRSVQRPTLHARCRCGLKLIYPESNTAKDIKTP